MLSTLILPILWNHRKEDARYRAVRLWTIPLMVWVLGQLISVPGTMGQIPFLVLGSFSPFLLVVICCLFVAMRRYVKNELEVAQALPQGAAVFPMPSKRTFEPQRHGAGR